MLDETDGVDADLAEKPAVHAFVGRTAFMPGVGFLGEDLHDGSQTTAADQSAHFAVGLFKGGAGHFVEAESAAASGVENGVQILLAEGAGLLGIDMAAGLEAAEGIPRLLIAAGRTETDETDIGVRQEGVEGGVLPDIGLGAKGLRQSAAGESGKCDEAGAGVFADLAKDLVAVVAVKADANGRGQRVVHGFDRSGSVPNPSRHYYSPVAGRSQARKGGGPAMGGSVGQLWKGLTQAEHSPIFRIQNVGSSRMLKITFLGAGSTMFAQRLLGDCFLTPALRESHMALYDIDPERLRESYRVMAYLNETVNKGRARITAHLGVGQRRRALRGARYVINAVQIGGLEAIRNDFEIPKRYGLLQTVGDTLGIGGIFRALRTIPVVLDFARDMTDVCPEAWLLNYTNPMAMVTGAVLHGPYPVRCVGLCHSVQGCVRGLLLRLGMIDDVHEEIPITHIANADPGRRLQWTIAGINHQAWLLEVRDHGRDLYPEIKRRAFRMNREALRPGAPKHDNMVRFEILRHFGYYVTESSHHAAEYMPYWIKARFPHLLETFNIPVDNYFKRIAHADEQWKRQVAETRSGRHRPKYRSHEYGSYILEAMETDVAVRIHGNVLNRGFIPNLPARAIVEVPCLVDRNGVAGVVVGDLPEICAAINRASIPVQLLTIEAALTRKRETVYHAAYVDPHTSSELTLDQIRALCDELFEAHRKWLPRMT